MSRLLAYDREVTRSELDQAAFDLDGAVRRHVAKQVVAEAARQGLRIGDFPENSAASRIAVTHFRPGTPADGTPKRDVFPALVVCEATDERWTVRRYSARIVAR